MFLFQIADLFGGDHIMVGAATVDENKILFRYLRRDEATEIFIGNKEDILMGQIFYDLYGIGRSHADIGPGFDLGGGVDVAYNRQILILCSHFLNDMGRNHVCHGTVRCQIGHENFFGGIQDLCTLAHKGDTAENDDIRCALLCDLRKIE